LTAQPGLARYAGTPGLPRLVAAAVDLARRRGFDRACTPEAGRLLQRLAAARPGLQVLETGTGCGVGAAWLLSGMDQSSRLVTVEPDRDLATAVAALFASDARVRVVAGDWTLARQLAPFDLASIAGGPDKTDPFPILELMARGGVIVLDDLTPDHDSVAVIWSAIAEVDAEDIELAPGQSALVVKIPDR
jgi:predicted O-methyltransferase YrrM